jgi:hypothetical protein
VKQAQIARNWREDTAYLSVSRDLGATEQTYYRGRKGGLTTDICI